MNSEELKRLQAPLKDIYRADPVQAMITLKAEARLGEGISCKVNTGRAMVEAGLHLATGGTGMLACSGDMLLEALVACAGVTLTAVASAIGISIASGIVRAEGNLDFRGTLGVSKEVPVGFQKIRLLFELVYINEPPTEAVESLLKLTKRYCVVYQTVSNGTSVETIINQPA